ncbi:MAG: glycosyl transferase [Actinobacteria bacterium HGW-Actinobacteria-7]|jgi:glycosyltransferase involved in cell wall biosynthesis|nr:MAG: glycosyl transferase [Actinobacteria bacterium HGW-Actinobacteria-7]
MDIAVLIPAHEESDRIADTVRASSTIPNVTRVVVVDDGSIDDTAQQAEAAGAKVVRLWNNVGKGAALEAGAMRIENADIILLLDGDLGTTAEQGASLLKPIVEGRADMVIATFPRPEGKAGFGIVKGLARWGIRLMGHGLEVEAPLSGQRALTRECLEAVRPFATGYGVEVALTVRARRSGLRVIEVPTTMTHAATGRDVHGFLHRGRQFVHVGLALLGLAFERR